jgi:hypothetical protein
MEHQPMVVYARRLASHRPADFLMSREMLRGIKQRAESLASTGHTCF